MPNRALRDAIVDWRQQRRRALTEDDRPARSSGEGYVAWEPRIPDLEDPVVKYIEHLYEGDRDEKASLGQVASQLLLYARILKHAQ